MSADDRPTDPTTPPQEDTVNHDPNGTGADRTEDETPTLAFSATDPTSEAPTAPTPRSREPRPWEVDAAATSRKKLRPKLKVA